MKKLVLAITSLLLIFSLCACSAPALEDAELSHTPIPTSVPLTPTPEPTPTPTPTSEPTPTPTPTSTPHFTDEEFSVFLQQLTDELDAYWEAGNDQPPDLDLSNYPLSEQQYEDAMLQINQERTTPTPAPTPEPEPAPKSSTTVYITKTGSKYHRGSCSYLKKSKIEISLDSAIAQGYEPCSRCNP